MTDVRVTRGPDIVCDLPASHRNPIRRAWDDLRESLTLEGHVFTDKQWGTLRSEFALAVCAPLGNECELEDLQKVDGTWELPKGGCCP